MTPEVSIIIANYNNAAYLPEAIDSILAQEGVGEMEIIVVDDASTDDTPRVLEAYRDRIVACLLPANTGGAAAPRNAGLRLARGGFIAILDSDDVMLPGKLREQIGLMKRHPDIGFCFTNFINFSARGDAPQDFLADHARFHALERHPLGSDAYRLPAARAFETLMVDNFVGTSGVVLRRSLIDDVGFFDEGLRCAEDLEYWIRLTRKHDMAYVDRVCHRRRLHPANVSSRSSSMTDALSVAQRLHGADLTPEARRNLRAWLASLHFVVGYNYRREGQRMRAIGHYLQSLRFKLINPEASLAILKALLPLPGRSAG